MKCKICGRDRLREMCRFCRDFHFPEECRGEACPICEEITEIVKEERSQK